MPPNIAVSAARMAGAVSAAAVSTGRTPSAPTIASTFNPIGFPANVVIS